MRRVRALHLAFSSNKSLRHCSRSRRRSSLSCAPPLATATSRCMSRILSRKTCTSWTRALYCSSPLVRVECWILSFSWSKPISSFRRITCAPRMSRSLITLSYSFRCVRACAEHRGRDARRVHLTSMRVVSFVISSAFGRDSGSERPLQQKRNDPAPSLIE